MRETTDMSRAWKGKWICTAEFSELIPRNVYHKELSPALYRETAEDPPTLKQYLDTACETLVQRTMAQYGGDKRLVAQRLGIAYSSLCRLLKKD